GFLLVAYGAVSDEPSRGALCQHRGKCRAERTAMDRPLRSRGRRFRHLAVPFRSWSGARAALQPWKQRWSGLGTKAPTGAEAGGREIAEVTRVEAGAACDAARGVGQERREQDGRDAQRFEQAPQHVAQL